MCRHHCNHRVTPRSSFRHRRCRLRTVSGQVTLNFVTWRLVDPLAIIVVGGVKHVAVTKETEKIDNYHFRGVEKRFRNDFPVVSSSRKKVNQLLTIVSALPVPVLAATENQVFRVNQSYVRGSRESTFAQPNRQNCIGSFMYCTVNELLNCLFLRCLRLD